MKIKEIVIVTGLSGGGKSSALKVFEDMNYYTIDNFPLGLDKALFDIQIEKLAIGVDIRTFKTTKDFFDFIDLIKEKNIKYNIIFLKAEKNVILGRYNLSRRAHPLKRNSLLESIEEEIKILFSVKEISNYIIDTTHLKPTELEAKIREQIKIDEKKLNVHIQSFGFKYGIPLDSDLIFDVRFMPNPYYIPELKEKNGYDKEIIDYVMKNHENLEFCEYLKNMLLFLIPKYIKEGKKHLTISIGCSGGKHRSVVVANNLSEDLKHLDYLNLYINHREKNVGHW